MIRPVPSRALQIIVVDDDKLLCQLLAEYFEVQGHACDWLDDGRQLAPWLRLNPQCDAAVIDVNMPRLNGMDLLSQIRESHPHLPVLIYTGSGFDETKMQIARDKGASGYISKGLPLAEIHAAVYRVVQQGTFNKTAAVEE